MNLLEQLGIISLTTIVITLLLVIAYNIITFEFQSCTQEFSNTLDELAKNIRCAYE